MSRGVMIPNLVGTANAYLRIAGHRIASIGNELIVQNGIGTLAKLAASAIRLVDGAQSGYVLTSDASGNGTWQALLAIEDVAVIAFPTATVSTGIHPVRIYNPTSTNRVITKVFVYAGAVASGGDTRIDVQVNGATVLGTDLILFNGQSSIEIDNLDFAWNAGSYLRVEIIQTAATSGGYYTIHVVHKPIG